jgi:hypothetical protein
MKDLVGKRFAISGMTIEVLSDQGDKYQVRNVTTRDILEMDKTMLVNAIKLGKAEQIPATGGAD